MRTTTILVTGIPLLVVALQSRAEDTQRRIQEQQQEQRTAQAYVDQQLESMLRSQNLPGPGALPGSAFDCREAAIGGSIIQRLTTTKKFHEYEFVHGGGH